MSAIGNLSKVTTLTATDLVAIFSDSLGCDSATTMTSLAAFLQTLLSTVGSSITQYFAPALTGWTVTISPVTNGQSVFLLLTPTAGFAVGTITLPLQTTCLDGQTITVTTTQAVTALTVAGNGATAVNGAPTTLAANNFFGLRYDAPSKSWYRVR